MNVVNTQWMETNRRLEMNHIDRRFIVWKVGGGMSLWKCFNVSWDSIYYLKRVPINIVDWDFTKKVQFLIFINLQLFSMQNLKF